MKSFAKRAGALTAAIAVMGSLVTGTGVSVRTKTYATSDGDCYEYYFEQLSDNPLAQNFYKAFHKLYEEGTFKSPTIEYDLIANGVAGEDVVAAYVNGANNNLVKAYGAGRDAFYMDHPDLFYADVFSTSIHAGQQGQKYVAYLDSSIALTVYRGNLDSAEKIDAAIASYESKLSAIVSAAKQKSGVVERIQYVNERIADIVEYSYGTEVIDGRNVDTPAADYIYTSYGALVNEKSVCEGYAKSFKAVMDRLQIPCVCVQGYADGSGKGDYMPHMWNYVQVDGMWYMVDVTYNDTGLNLTKWVLVGEQACFDTHIPDGSVSTSDYELRYPALKPYKYGTDLDENGMTVVGTYKNTNNQGKTLTLTVSYDGKGALKLQEEGKYLAYRFSTDGDTQNWTNWTNIVAVNEAMSAQFDGEFYPVTDYDTSLRFDTDVAYAQFALLNRAPDVAGNLLTGDAIVAYNPDSLSDDDFITELSVPYRNEGFASYFPTPGAAGVTPSNAGDLPVDRTYDIKIVYTDDLELTDGATPDTIGMDFVTSYGNDTVKEHAVLENFHWDGEKTITFTFTPSRMYVHNLATYYFTPVGLVGAKSKKVPDPVRYTFKGKSVVCSKVFNDGRLYMSVYGQPSLLDSSDLSVTDFKDEKGNYYAESQRSQLILVASKPSAEKEQKMDEVLKQETGIKQDEIVASSTYEIDLQICGMVQKVPNGSYMQVAFGFPEGYSPDDAGTTFKIYHYKHDNAGNITGVEEIPVVVTQYGLIAKVSSFSPFTIVQVKNTSLAVTESDSVNVYAYVNNAMGGTVTTDGKSGIAEVTGKTVTYDITPNEGYKIACVRLNGKVIDASNYKNGKLTLSKSDLDSGNTLEVVFVTVASANSYEDKGVSFNYGTPSNVSSPTSKSNVAGIAIGVTVAVLGLVGGGIAIWWFFLRKKPAPETESAPAPTQKADTKKAGTAPKAATAKKQTGSSQNTTGTAKTSAVKRPAAAPKATKKSSSSSKTTSTKSTGTAAKTTKSPSDKNGKK